MSEEKAAFEGILVAAYVDQGAADEVLKTVNEAKKEENFQFWDAAVIRKDERGRYYFNETRDMSTPKGAGIGAIIGGLIGIPGGPAGIILGSGLGAALGGFAASADAVYGFVAAFGLTFISNFLVAQQIWFRLIGGGFLIYLGIRAYFSTVDNRTVNTSDPKLAGAYGTTFLLTLSNPALQPIDLIKAIVLRLGGSAENGSKTVLLDQLHQLLNQNAQKGFNTVLAIDEAHVIGNSATLDELRMLLNIQSDDEFLITLILLGSALRLVSFSASQG